MSSMILLLIPPADTGNILDGRAVVCRYYLTVASTALLR